MKNLKIDPKLRHLKTISTITNLTKRKTISQENYPPKLPPRNYYSRHEIRSDEKQNHFENRKSFFKENPPCLEQCLTTRGILKERSINIPRPPLENYDKLNKYRTNSHDIKILKEHTIYTTRNINSKENVISILPIVKLKPKKDTEEPKGALGDLLEVKKPTKYNLDRIRDCSGNLKINLKNTNRKIKEVIEKFIERENKLIEENRKLQQENKELKILLSKRVY